MSGLNSVPAVTVTTEGPLHRYHLPMLPIWHGFFSRAGGFSQKPYAGLNTAFATQDPAAADNRALLLRTLGLADRPLRILNPCHGDRIAFLDAVAWEAPAAGPVLRQTDAAFTTRTGSCLLMSTADCIPAVFCTDDGTLAGLVHLGWRNLVANLTAQVIATLRRHGIEPPRLQIGIGPCIHPCCYVFREPLQKNDPFWQPFLQDRGSGDYGIDLVGAFRRQLHQAGVPAANIHETGLCTGCRPAEFYSCYREGQLSGRFPTLVALPAAGRWP
jgi:hypothetical protein